MLQPKRTKFRKTQKGRIKGLAYRGSDITAGSFGLKTLDEGFITSRQIEAARIALTRYMKREGKVWIRIFPDKPMTSKPAEVRMGKGKGAPSHWVAVVKPGRIMFEAEGVPLAVAKEALRLAAQKLPVKTKFVVRPDYVEQRNMKGSELKDLSEKDLLERLNELKEALGQMKFQHSVTGLESPIQIKGSRRDVARVLTELNSRKAK